ncbi:MAG: methyltransferase [Deltaproteobacteria bacterium]|nr:methyltransferase [Deltaproteobacteria bacterium]
MTPTPITNNSNTLLNGGIHIRQPTHGYRFSMDTVILAQNVGPKRGDKILDIGTGCGVIPILIAHRHSGVQITGIELQKELFDIARKNVAENKMADTIRILNMDARHITPADTDGPFDMVVSNPPYTAVGSGRINPCLQQALARHEIELNLKELIATAKLMLKPSGKFIVIYPEYRLNELIEEMRMAGFEPGTIKMVHTKPGQAAKRVLVSAIAGTGHARSVPDT